MDNSKGCPFDVQGFAQVVRQHTPFGYKINGDNFGENISYSLNSSENAEAVQFQPNDEWKKHTTTSQNGDTADGYRCLSARLLVLRRSALLMFDRDSGDYLGPYQKDGYDRNTIVLKTRYLVYLVDAANQLLHDQPLLFTTKGAMCGDFGEVYQKFRREMSRSFGQARGTHKPRGDKFMALSVMEMTVKPVLKGYPLGRSHGKH
jgi:hypothetical protein